MAIVPQSRGKGKRKANELPADYKGSYMLAIMRGLKASEKAMQEGRQYYFDKMAGEVVARLVESEEFYPGELALMLRTLADKVDDAPAADPDVDWEGVMG